MTRTPDFKHISEALRTAVSRSLKDDAGEEMIRYITETKPDPDRLNSICEQQVQKLNVVSLTPFEEHSLMKPQFSAMDLVEAKVKAVVAKHPDIPASQKAEAAKRIMKRFSECMDYRSVERLTAEEALTFVPYSYENLVNGLNLKMV